ncbi:MAG: alpha/beta fold hydrolase [Candidatus Woykebacteria bacterium]
MFQQKIKFKNSLGLNLSAIFEGESEKDPLVVLCHGYNSSKDGISAASLSKKLIENGLSVFRFDFTGNGKSEGKLSDLTPLQGLDDLQSAVSHLGVEHFGLCGSNFGGHVALMYAAKNPVLALALKAPVSDYLWVIGKEEPSGRRQRFIKVLEGLDIYKEAKKIKAPVLIVHGDKDDVVPVEQSKKLFDYLGGEKQLEIIKGASHQFRDDYLEKVNNLIADFFEERLK